MEWDKPQQQQHAVHVAHCDRHAHIIWGTSPGVSTIWVCTQPTCSTRRSTQRSINRQQRLEGPALLCRAIVQTVVTAFIQWQLLTTTIKQQQALLRAWQYHLVGVLHQHSVHDLTSSSKRYSVHPADQYDCPWGSTPNKCFPRTIHRPQETPSPAYRAQ
jgi:hypothetical protein